MLWAGEIPAPGSYIHAQGSQSSTVLYWLSGLSVQSRTGYQKPGTSTYYSAYLRIYLVGSAIGPVQ